MEQLFFVGKAYLKINSLVKMPLHEFMAVERSGLWAPAFDVFQCALVGFHRISRFLDLLHNHCNYPPKMKLRLS